MGERDDERGLNFYWANETLEQVSEPDVLINDSHNVSLNSACSRCYPTNHQAIINDPTAIRHMLADAIEPSFQLGPINLTLHAGERVFIVGGKSTLAEVITGLYKTTRGNILLNDEAFSNPAILSELYSSVFFDLILFPQAIDDKGHNISDEVLTQWIERLDLAHKVTAKNGQLSTTDLSQG